MLGDLEADGQVEHLVELDGESKIVRTEAGPVDQQPLSVHVVPVDPQDGLDALVTEYAQPTRRPVCKP